MKKYILGFIIIGLLAVSIYYGRYFVFDNEVNEAAPNLMIEESNQELPASSNFQITKREGNFVEVDRIHKGSGKAILLTRGVGGTERVLRFEDFKVTNGPDLYVWLTKNPNPNSKIESLGDYIDLGKLKGNIGDQNYEFNSTDFNVDNIDAYTTAVIWCKQFSQLFSYANLKTN